MCNSDRRNGLVELIDSESPVEWSEVSLVMLLLLLIEVVVAEVLRVGDELGDVVAFSAVGDGPGVRDGMSRVSSVVEIVVDGR